MKMRIQVHSAAAEADAKALSRELEEENLRGLKVSRQSAEPEEGALSGPDWLPIIELVLEPSLAVALLSKLFDLLKTGFFVESKRIKSEERIAMAKIAQEKEKAKAEAGQARREQKLKYLELVVELGGKEYLYKLTAENVEEQQEMLQQLLEDLK